MRDSREDHSARVLLALHAFVQNLRRGQYELAIEEPVSRRLPSRSRLMSSPWRFDVGPWLRPQHAAK
jgi:hypothetical protein